MLTVFDSLFVSSPPSPSENAACMPPRTMPRSLELSYLLIDLYYQRIPTIADEPPK